MRGTNTKQLLGVLAQERGPEPRSPRGHADRAIWGARGSQWAAHPGDPQGPEGPGQTDGRRVTDPQREEQGRGIRARDQPASQRKGQSKKRVVG